MSDVNISKFRAQVIRTGSTPASPGFAVSEGQNPVDPSGSGQTHLPVTIATASTGLSITESQILSGAGLVSQYIRGDGSLADFPATTGGGSSVSYYLNGSVSQGTIGGVAYKELNRAPVFGAGTDITINADGYIASFITDALDPNKLLIPAGNWNFETYFSASSNGGSPSFYVELYKYNGTTFTLIASSSTAPELIAFGTNLNPYFSTLAVPETVLALTDRLALRYYVTHSGRTITLHTENGHLCEVITTFTTGLTALNGLTNQVQFFAVGTSGTDFAISSVADTHTFNLPTASATNRGALSSADWTTFNGKTSNLGTVTSVGLSSATSGVTIGSTPVTTSGTITLAIATASGSQNGLLSSTDWTTFNGKQNALTNPVTGTGTTNYLPKFTGASTIGNSILSDSGTRLTQNSGDGFAISTSSSDTVGSGSFLALTNLAQTRWILQQLNASFGLDWWSFNGTSWSTRMQLTAGGNLLVGTTTDNGYKLDVNGTGRFNGTMSLENDGTYGSTYKTLGFTGNSNGSHRIFAGTADDMYFAAATARGFQFWTNGAATTRMIITSGGNVGIGTTSPAAIISGTETTLNVKGATASSVGSIVARSFGTTNLTTIGLAAFDTINLTAIYVESNSPLAIYTNGSEKMRITSTGKIFNSNAPSGDWALELFSNLSTNNAFGLHIRGGTSSTDTPFFVENAAGLTSLFRITGTGNVLIGTSTSGASKLRIVGLPTSAAGLSSGDVYNLAGTLMIA